MGISNWIQTEAKKIIQATKEKETIVFETGYGPSGLPHIGTFAENARMCFVIEAVRSLEPSKKTTLIVFSDDFDGLRKAPENIPNAEIMVPYLGSPLTSVPSPNDPDISFGESNNMEMRKFLDFFDFKYQFISSTKHYQSGKFDEGLKKIMDNYDTIKVVVEKSISRDKREHWSPFIALCEQCKKINTTRITDYDQNKYTVSYSCRLDADGYKSCGHQGEVSIFGGRTKVGWKVDWAMRWVALNVDYEMHGEDLTESMKVSRSVCNVLKHRPPLMYKYELFLDENKQKISKKLGNGLSMKQWMDYSPLGALIYLLLGNPQTSKKMGLSILPKIIDDFISGVSKSDPRDITEPRWYLNHFKKAAIPKISTKIGYNLLVSVGYALGKPDAGMLYDYVARYDATVNDDRSFYTQLCDYAVKFISDVPPLKEEYTLDKSMLPYLKNIKTYLESSDAGETLDGDKFQTFLFDVCKRHDLNQRHWFVFLYNVFLEKNSGPKMGPFFAVLGKQAALERVTQKITPI